MSQVPVIFLNKHLLHTMCLFLPRLVIIISLGVVYALPIPLIILVLKLSCSVLIDMPQLM